ncbi:hypothetical protein [Streptomyces globisporus]|uniref:hypothetical protein n=1 Tax=Streptomyces globisporus TaxID=1908 RepID=UPI0036989EDD
MLAWILSLILPVSFLWAPMQIPAVLVPVSAHESTETKEWEEFHSLAYQEHADTFTALYKGYETKWSKNGRLMIRQGSTGPYKFVKKG